MMKKKLFFYLSAALIALYMIGCSDPEPELESHSDISAPVEIYGAATRDTIAVSWSAVPRAVSYNVYSGTAETSLSKHGSSSSITYTITGLSSDTRYYIAVSSVDSAGEGKKGTVIPVTTKNANTSETKYSKEFLGEWMRMDTGEKWYINSTTLKIDDAVSSKIVSLSKQSDRVIKVTEGSRVYYLFGFRIANAQFTGRIASFQQPPRSVMRGISGGFAGVATTISNLEESLTQSKNTDAQGRYTADDIILNEDYMVTPAGGTATKVRPQVNGDDVGTITVTEGANIKISIVSTDQQDMTLLYANQTYYFNLEIENTGDVLCNAPVYTLDFGAANTSSSREGLIQTIMPGIKKIIPITLRYAPTSNPYEFHKIGITINDQIADRTWEDSVSLKIHKGTVNFNIRAQTPNTGRASAIAGIIVTPDARVYYFKDAYTTISVPTTDEDYWVIFSGATADTEVVYSLGIGVGTASNLDGFTEPSKYEPNDTEGTATLAAGNQITAYLLNNDIDYYRVNVTNGLGNITISPPSLTDESISGFPAAAITIAKTSGTTPSTQTIEVAEGYTSYKWYVDNVLRSSTRSLILNAANYGLGRHTITIVVYKNGVPYSKEQTFTVIQ